MKYAKKGYAQGDMKCEVEDIQRPASTYSQAQAGKTTEYVSRQNAIQEKAASKQKSFAYKGRYS